MPKNFKVRALETKYDGYHFRSRIEARWAMFFKLCGVKYEYEKEGYELSKGNWYLCDFWLNTDQAWVEIKGAYPNRSEIAKLRLLAQHTNCKAAYIFYGSIPNPNTWRKTWQTLSVLPNSPNLMPWVSDARITSALIAARSARF